MPFDYLDDSPSSGKFEYMDEPGFAEKTMSNIIPDLGQTAVNLGNMVKEGAYEMPKRALQTGVEMAGGVPFAETPSGQKAEEFVANAPALGEEMVRPIIHPVDYMAEHPVQQAMNILGLKEGISGMMGRKPPVAPMEMVSKPSVTPEAPFSPEVPAQAPAPEIPKAPEAAAAPAPSAAIDPLKDVKDFVSSKLGEDPLKDVREYVKSKTDRIESNPGWPTRAAKYMKEESNNLGAKDLGLQMRQVRSMGPGFKGTEKAAALIDYAREKGYLDPTLSDVARKEKIISTQKASGAQMDAIRNIADKRAVAPVEAIKAAVQQELQAKYGAGVEKSPAEIKNVMEDIEKARPTFTGMSELATKLNKSATAVKDLGQHPGPTTDAANIISRMNNEAIRKVLNPQEAQAYTESLRDYGANKKLEQVVAGADIRKMTARTNQRGIFGRLFQEALDRGGYRVGGNVMNKMADTILKNPGKIKTLPDFFEEFAHQSNDTIDDIIDGPKMYEGGMVPDDIAEFVRSR